MQGGQQYEAQSKREKKSETEKGLFKVRRTIERMLVGALGGRYDSGQMQSVQCAVNGNDNDGMG